MNFEDFGNAITLLTWNSNAEVSDALFYKKLFECKKKVKVAEKDINDITFVYIQWRCKINDLIQACGQTNKEVKVVNSARRAHIEILKLLFCIFENNEAEFGLIKKAKDAAEANQQPV